MSLPVAEAADAPEAVVAGLAARARRVETPSGDGAMVWRIWGEGPPVVFLHGGYGSWTHWIRNIPFFARHYTVIVPDLPGFADSADPPAPHTMAGIGEIVSRGLDIMVPPPQRVVIVGFSFGSGVGGMVCRLQGERIGRFIMTGAGALGPRVSATAGRATFRNRDAAAVMDAHFENLRSLMITDPAHIDALALHLQASHAPRARVRSMKISRTPPLREVVPELTQPLSAIWGEHDPIVKSQIEERMDFLRSQDPAAELTVIPDAGHWVQYEQADRYNEVLAPLLATPRMRG